MKSVKIILRFLYLKLKTHLSFRLDVIFEIFYGLIESLFAFIFFEVVYSYVNNIVGFEKGEIYILTGTAYFIDGIYKGIFGTGIFSLSQLVRRGRLEKYLLRPFKAEVLILFREPRFDFLYRFPSYFAIFIYGFYLLKKLPSFFDFLLYFFSFLISLFIYLLLHYIFVLLSFWLIEMYNLYYLIYDFYEFARYPEKIYKGIFRKIFISIIPIIILSNYPVKFLFKEANLFLILYELLILSLFFIIFKFMWDRGIKRYEGATI
jgi:ABC-2 type transport system permease protein